MDEVQQELVVAALPMGAAVGAMLAGYVVDKFGRRGAIIGNGILFAIASIVLVSAASFQQVIIGRIICGVAIGKYYPFHLLPLNIVIPDIFRWRLSGERRGRFVISLRNFACITPW